MIFINYYNKIKNIIIDDIIYQKLKDYSKEQHKVKTYFEIGKILNEAGKHYGDNIIGKYSKRLSTEVDKRYNVRTLRRFRQFYMIFNEKWSTVSTKLSWSHYSELLILNDYDSINYYINISIKYNLGVRQLREKIKNKEYERLPYDTKEKLKSNQITKIQDLVKNPIIINNKQNTDIVSEKILQRLILEDISSFLEQLGDGYSFIKNEYKIKLGNTYNYIDLLLFNYIYNCFVVIELKVTELKKEHIGQIQIYMNYIDKNVKTINHNNTIGIIIVKKDNTIIIEYSSDKRIFETTYKIKS